MSPRALWQHSQRELAGKSILLPRAAVARDLIPVELAKKGAVVDVVEAYRNVVPPDAEERAATILGGPQTGLDHFHQFIDSEELSGNCRSLGSEWCEIASIGPVTSDMPGTMDCTSIAKRANSRSTASSRA